MPSIANLKFADLCVPSSAEECWYKETSGSLAALPVPSEFHPDLARLREFLESHPPDPDFRVDFDGIRLRVERMDTAGGSGRQESVYVCRRFRDKPSKLPELGFPDPIVKRLLAPDTRNGLIIFMGKTGSGKTTAASAFVVDWLSSHGGVCWTVENPVEIQLQGRWGKGVCYQTEALDDHGFGDVIIKMMRASLNLMLIGEIREEGAARAAQFAAMSGHLVVTTFHANDIVSGLARFSGLARDTGYLAEAVRAVLHLQLKERPGGGQVLVVEPLWVSGQGEDGIRSTIRSGNFQLLKSEIDRQRRMLMSTGGG